MYLVIGWVLGGGGAGQDTFPMALMVAWRVSAGMEMLLGVGVW